MKYLFILLGILSPAMAGATFLGEYCGAQDDSYLLVSPKKITREKVSGQLSFVRSDADGEEVDVVLESGSDFEIAVRDIMNEYSSEEKVRCADGHDSISKSGSADVEFVFHFKDESKLSKALKKQIRGGELRTSLSCQWSAEERPCAE